jgi:hypothetical protein
MSEYLFLAPIALAILLGAMGPGPRTLSDLGGRSEAERDRGHFFDHLRRIVSLLYENDREKAPISYCRSRFFLSPTGS